MGSLLNDASAHAGDSPHRPDKPLSQTHSEHANIKILQEGGFCNIKVQVACNKRLQHVCTSKPTTQTPKGCCLCSAGDAFL